MAREQILGLAVALAVLALQPEAHATEPAETRAPAVTPLEDPRHASGTRGASSASLDPDSQPPAERTTPPAALQDAAADIVVLHDGSVLRGTIVERIANSHVTVVVPTGATYRFPLGQVAYAGPEQRSAAAAGSVPGAPIETILLRFVANDYRTTLHVWSFTPASRQVGGYYFAPDQRLCTGSCVVRVPKGNYRFALSGKNEHRELIPGAFDLREDTQLSGEHHCYRARRVGGWLLFGASLPIGLVTALAAKRRGARAAGGIAGLAGAAVGLTLALTFDEASLDVAEPAARPPYPHMPAPTREPVGFVEREGTYFALTGHF